MKVREVIIYVVAVSVLFGSLCGCGGKDDRPEEEADPNVESRSPSTTSVTPAVKPATDAERLKRQIVEVRRTFLSLQEVCRANDIEGYLDFWDDETKMLDGRDLSLEERRELRRKILKDRPKTFREIAYAEVKSITVDTSQAEKLENIYGVEIKGTMMLVRTNSRALLFHETDKGWKLFTLASPEYFR
ncbi:MAG: hypothetical protein ACYS91_14895 [Planctomycetota bacterium]|jgi:hypothetical protein